MGIRYGETLARFGQPDEALRLIDEALAEADGAGHEGRAIRARIAKATALAAMGRLDEAERWLDDAVRRMSADEVTNRITLAGAARLRAEIALARKHHAEAAQAIAASLERLRYPHEEQNLHIARALLVDARVRLAGGDVAGAIKAAREAAVAFEELTLDPEQSADAGEALLVLAGAQDSSGDYTDARRNAKRAAKALANGLGAELPLSREAAALAERLDQR
jgi:tetratricopeptide (TPR) repeat protein